MGLTPVTTTRDDQHPSADLGGVVVVVHAIVLSRLWAVGVGWGPAGPDCHLVFRLGGVPGDGLSDCFADIDRSGYYCDVLVASRRRYVATCARCIGRVLAGVHYILGPCPENRKTSIPCGPRCHGPVRFDLLAPRVYDVAQRIAAPVRKRGRVS